MIGYNLNIRGSTNSVDIEYLRLILTFFPRRFHTKGGHECDAQVKIGTEL